MKQKPTIQLLGMLVTMLCASLSASAYDFKTDRLYYKILSEEDRTIEVTCELPLFRTGYKRNNE